MVKQPLPRRGNVCLALQETPQENAVVERADALAAGSLEVQSSGWF